jgi:hypothetical protein
MLEMQSLFNITGRNFITVALPLSTELGIWFRRVFSIGVVWIIGLEYVWEDGGSFTLRLALFLYTGSSQTKLVVLTVADKTQYQGKFYKIKYLTAFPKHFQD